MENVKSTGDIIGLRENQIMGGSIQFLDSNIFFRGRGNLVLCDGDVNLKDSTLFFNGNNALIYLCGGAKVITVQVTIYNNSVLFIGRNNYFNPHGERLRIFCTEQRHVLIGDGCLFSTGVDIHTADAHLIYSMEDRSRLNLSQSVYIGDKVWVGQNATLLKGTMIHSGSIIGASSVISNKKIMSNCCWGGNPGRLIRKNVFWNGKCVHGFLDNETKQYLTCISDDTIFSYDENDSISFAELDRVFSNKTTALNKAEKIKAMMSNRKNRFA